jgi:hypothetical protein
LLAAVLSVSCFSTAAAAASAAAALFVACPQLSGPLPTSYGQLKSLVNLSLNDNGFSGPIPTSWSGMTSLQKLYLYNNPSLSGCVPAGLQEQLQLSFGFGLKDYVEEGTRVQGYCSA